MNTFEMNFMNLLKVAYKTWTIFVQSFIKIIPIFQTSGDRKYIVEQILFLVVRQLVLLSEFVPVNTDHGSCNLLRSVQENDNICNMHCTVMVHMQTVLVHVSCAGFIVDNEF